LTAIHVDETMPISLGVYASIMPHVDDTVTISSHANDFFL